LVLGRRSIQGVARGKFLAATCATGLSAGRGIEETCTLDSPAAAVDSLPAIVGGKTAKGSHGPGAKLRAFALRRLIAAAAASALHDFRPATGRGRRPKYM